LSGHVLYYYYYYYYYYDYYDCGYDNNYHHHIFPFISSQGVEEAPDHPVIQ